MRSLVWFRSDLRVRDNTALSEACRAADDGVLAVFAICAAQWAEHDWAPVKVDFLLRNLADLSRSLDERRIPLLIVEEPRFAGVPRRLLEIAETHRCDAIWFNREYEVNELQRDAEVRRVFEDSGRSAHGLTDQTVVSPYDLRTSQGTFYTVFTPYRRKWLQDVEGRGGVRVLQMPPRQKPLDIEADPVPARIDAFEGLARPDLWKSGEEHARYRLRSFIEQRLESYHERRDIPGTNGTSTLSPYLTLGVLSPRQCLQAALDANEQRLASGSTGVTTWISELIWREFYRHVLVGFPRVCRNQPFDLKTREISWRQDESGLERWKSGTTGVPIVDAGMRQLSATGWMHNRVRMITAMFLTKNLFVDWRRGEEHFMRHLVDGDFASNNGGWQWSASTGTDAAPYFRIFNPVAQSERFDPDGEYIRAFVRELEGLDGSAIHLPGERAPDASRKRGYPDPIVDLKASRARAVERFREGIVPRRTGFDKSSIDPPRHGMTNDE